MPMVPSKQLPSLVLPPCMKRRKVQLKKQKTNKCQGEMHERGSLHSSAEAAAAHLPLRATRTKRGHGNRLRTHALLRWHLWENVPKKSGFHPLSAHLPTCLGKLPKTLLKKDTGHARGT